MPTLRAYALSGALIALVGQVPNESWLLEQDRLATLTGSPFKALILKAVHEDGTLAAKAWIACNGYWWKHTDEQHTVGGEAYPFKADSWGAVILNPFIDDNYFKCSATKDGKYGETEF